MMMPSMFGESLFDRWMNSMFDDEFTKNYLSGKNSERLLRTDIKENDNSYELHMDLPGYKKEDIKARLEQGYLTITAEKNEEKEEKSEENGKYIRRERYCGSCSRSFYVGDHVKQEDMKAKFEDGILKITFPKAALAVEEKKSPYIAIEG